MKRASSILLSGQLILAVAVILGISSVAQATEKRSTFKPTFKVEKCDCFGYSGDIETFLSDLENGSDIDIYGEGKSLAAATKKAHRMCVQHYRVLAEASKNKSVTETGCTKMRSTPDGDWVTI